MFAARRILITLAAAVALGGIAAAPALAAPPPQSSSVTVNATTTTAETISLTGVSATVNFPTIQVGSTGTATGAEQYTVATAGPGTGFTLTITPADSKLIGCGGPGCTIPNNDLSITENSLSTTVNFSGTAATPQTIDTTSTNPSSVSFNEDWHLAVPPGTQTGSTFMEGFTYLAMANS
jgi:hypothetical protein